MVIRKAFGSGELKIQSGSVIASPAFRKFTKHVKAREYEEEPFIGRKKTSDSPDTRPSCQMGSKRYSKNRI